MGRSYHAFTFVWNNWTPESLDRFVTWYKRHCSFCTYAFEIGEEKRTPHLQGCFWTIKKKQLSDLHKFELLKGIAPQVQYGNMASQHRYIVEGIKDGEKKEWAPGTTPVIWGEWPTEEAYAVQAPKQGKRNDLQAVIESAKKGATKRQIREEHPEAYARYSKFCAEVVNEAKQDRAHARLLEEYKDVVLRPWQEHLMTLLRQPPNRRQIIWVYDPKGNSGKSYMCDYIETQFPRYSVEVYNSGKSSDIAYQIDEPSIIIFDLARESEFMPYQLMEDLKNGRFMSPKYESIMKRIRIPHVVVMSNYLCKDGAFSEDRLLLIKVDS